MEADGKTGSVRSLFFISKLLSIKITENKYDNSCRITCVFRMTMLCLQYNKQLNNKRLKHPNMTSAQAKQIASNYMRQQSDYVFSAVTVKSLAPANGPVKVWLTTEDDYGDELIVEVEMNPQSNEIRWKKICNTGRLSEYLKPAIRIDKLSAGQRFRLQGDCVVYEFMDNVKDRSSIPYIIRRADRSGCVSRVGWQEVFPIE